MALIPIVNANGTFVELFDTEGAGVSLIYEQIGFAAGEPVVFVGDPEDFEGGEWEPDEWELQQAALNDWQLYRRPDGTYAHCSWIVADVAPGLPEITGRAVESTRSYCARIWSARETATFLVAHGLDLPPMMVHDFAVEPASSNKVAADAGAAGIATAIETVKHGSAQDDGPMPPRSFILGTKHAELTTSQFRLVSYLWQQERYTATKRNVSMTVWADEEAQSTRLPSLVSRTNERLLENGVRMTVEPNGDYVRLVIDRQ